MAKVLIADDHPLFREALRAALDNGQGERVSIREAHDLEAIKSALNADGDLDLILLDLKIPGATGFSGLVELKNSHPDIPIVVVSASEDAPTIKEAMAFGAAGFIPKSSGGGEIASAIQQVLAGDLYLPAQALGDEELSEESRERLEIARRMATLTPQQMRVLSLITEGKPNKIIAFELDVAETTVKAHITAILRKLKVHSRTQAVLAAQKHFSSDSIPD